MLRKHQVEGALNCFRLRIGAQKLLRTGYLARIQAVMLVPMRPFAVLIGETLPVILVYHECTYIVQI